MSLNHGIVICVGSNTFSGGDSCLTRCFNNSPSGFCSRALPAWDRLEPPACRGAARQSRGATAEPWVTAEPWGDGWGCRVGPGPGLFEQQWLPRDSSPTLRSQLAQRPRGCHSTGLRPVPRVTAAAPARAGLRAQNPQQPRPSPAGNGNRTPVGLCWSRLGTAPGPVDLGHWAAAGAAREAVPIAEQRV